MDALVRVMDEAHPHSLPLLSSHVAWKRLICCFPPRVLVEMWIELVLSRASSFEVALNLEFEIRAGPRLAFYPRLVIVEHFWSGWRGQPRLLSQTHSECFEIHSIGEGSSLCWDHLGDFTEEYFINSSLAECRRLFDHLLQTEGPDHLTAHL